MPFTSSQGGTVREAQLCERFTLSAADTALGVMVTSQHANGARAVQFDDGCVLPLRSFTHGALSIVCRLDQIYTSRLVYAEQQSVRAHDMPILKIADMPPWLLHDPCPCESGYPFGVCCRGHDIYPRIAVPRLLPNEPTTGLANPRCYLRSTHDCVKKISREHYISDAVLQTIGGGLIVSGAQWQRAGETKEMQAKSLVANILCKRHNESLSPLDTAAGKVFQAIATIYDDLRASAEQPGNFWYLRSGEMLELWSLKVIFGLHRAGIATSNRQPIRDSHQLDSIKFIEALSARRLEEPCGVYVTAGKHGQTVSKGVEVEGIGMHDPPKIGGVQIGIYGLEFDFVFDPSAVYRGRIQQSAYRPRCLTFRKGPRRHSILLTWPPSSRLEIEPELEVTVSS